MACSSDRKGRNQGIAGETTVRTGHDDEECAGRAGGFPLRRDFGFLTVEELTLDVMRCLFDVYGTGSGQGWDVAVAHAEESLGATDGPVLVARVTSFLRALRLERRGGVKYLGFGCEHICDDELAILTLMKAKRTGDARSLNRAMLSVTNGSPAAYRIDRAATELCALQLLLMGGQDGTRPGNFTAHSSERVH